MLQVNHIFIPEVTDSQGVIEKKLKIEMVENPSERFYINEVDLLFPVV
jgi:hypothetical protein